MIKRSIFYTFSLLCGFSLAGAISISTNNPVRPGGFVASGQAQVMPHSGTAAIVATEKAGYKPLTIKLAKVADRDAGIFKLDYYPYFTAEGEKLLMSSGEFKLYIAENYLKLQLGKESYKVPAKFQHGIWYSLVVRWENCKAELLVDGKTVFSKDIPEFPIARTLTIGGMPDGLFKTIMIDRPKLPSVIALNGEKIDFSIRANNDKTFCFDYFAHGKALKLQLCPDMPIYPGEKFVILQTAGTPIYLTADTAGSLRADFPASYSNRVELRRDKGNFLSDGSFEEFPGAWQVSNIPGYADSDSRRKVSVYGKTPVFREKLSDSAVASDKVAHSGKKSVIMERRSHTGQLMISRKVDLPQNTGFLLGVYYKVLERKNVDSSLILQVKIFEDGKLKQTFREYHPFTPLRPTGKWEFAPLNFETRKSSGKLTAQIELITDGAPCRIAFDDISLREYPQLLYNPMPQDGDRVKKLTGKALMEHLKTRPAVKLPSFPLSGVSGYDGSTIYKMMDRSGADIQFIKMDIDHRLKKQAWDARGNYDFSEIDEWIIHVLEFAPDAAVGLHIGVDPVLDFGIVYPDAAWRNLKGEIVYMSTPRANMYPERRNKKFPYVSYTAPDFRRECGKFLYALGKHLQKQPWGKAVAGIHLHGGGDGQFFYRPIKNDFATMMDRSAGNLQAMREMIRKYYKNDVNALRKAWKDDKVTFESITFPDAKLYDKYLFQRDPQDPEARKLIDFAKLYPEAITESLGFCASEFERGLGRKVLKSRYYFGTSLGHLLENSPFDMFVSVPPYGVSRLHGDAGRVHQAPDSATLHKKIFVDELDLRTSYSPVAVYGRGTSFLRDGVEPGPEGFANLMRKMAAPCVTANQGYWYLMIGGSASLQYEFEKPVKESFDALKSTSQEVIDFGYSTALFWDEEARTMAGERFGWALDQHGTHQAQEVLYRAGLGVRNYLLKDLTNPERKAAKINIFALGTTMTEEQISFIEKNLQRDGNVLVFVFDAGRTAPGGFEKNIRRLTGMTVKANPGKLTLAAFSDAEFADPLSKYIRPAAPVTEGPFAIPQYFVDDPSAEPLALLARTDKVGAAIKCHKNWTAVYLSIPVGLGVKPEFFRTLAQQAGITPFAPAGDVSYAGNGLIAIHAVEDGKKQLNWGVKADVLDITQNKVILRNAEKMELDMKFGETRWFKLLKPAKKV